MIRALGTTLIVGIVATFAYAGVSKIASNGNISGASSCRVECSSGFNYIIYKKDGNWYRGDIVHMGNKYDSWSKNDVANFLCN